MHCSPLQHGMSSECSSTADAAWRCGGIPIPGMQSPLTPPHSPYSPSRTLVQ